MQLRNIIKRMAGIYNYDRYVEKLIIKSIKLYHTNSKINIWRSIRLHNKIREKYNCIISPGVKIGKNLYISHSHNILIGRTAIIGDNCRIYPNTSIVAAVKGDSERYKSNQRTHAKIGNNCIIGIGSMIIGPVTIGDDVTIAAGAIVTKDVPDYTVVKNVNEFRRKEINERKDTI